MNYYGLAGTMTAKQGRRDELTQILLQAAKLLQSNSGCIQYIISHVNDDPDVVWVSEVWIDKAAHDSSLEPQEIRDLVMSALPLLANSPQQGSELKVLGGKGLILS